MCPLHITVIGEFGFRKIEQVIDFGVEILTLNDLVGFIEFSAALVSCYQAEFVDA
jgi:hypothetical protein